MRLALLLLASCNQIYGLEPATAIDNDRDADGVHGFTDNCADVANPTQADEDRDTIGDACDNCPGIANSEQQDDGDGDSVGDDCDPHPDAAGDCLVVFDSFDDPSTFADTWSVVGDGANPIVEPQAGSVHVPEQPLAVGLIVRATDALPDTLNIIVGGHLALTNDNAQFRAFSGANTLTTSGNACLFIRVGMSEVMSVEASAPGLAAAVGVTLLDTIAHRLVNTDRNGDPIVSCRSEHGIAFFAFTRAGAQAARGMSGVQVRFADATLDAISVYAFQPGTACPVEVRR